MWASVQRLHRLRSVGALAAVLALGTAAPASAEDVSIADGTLAVRAAPGEHNALLIQPDSLGSYQVYDDGAPVTPGAGCTALAKHGVRCSGPVLGVSVDAGDGDDVVGAWAVSIPMTVSGGDGDDLVDSGTASDRVTGDAGLDTVVAGAGDDSVSGGDGGDMLEGGDGTDTISGDGGDDIARAGDGSQEVVSGGAGRDLLDGGPGDDTVSGDAGDDAIAGGSGSDTLSTGSGKDSVYVGNQTSDSIHCQQGDEVHAPASEVPPGCTALAPSSHLPDSWPPKTTATKPTAQAAHIFNPRTIATKLLRRGHVQRLALWVDGPVNRAARVRVTAYDRHHHQLVRFFKDVRTRNADQIAAAPPPEATWSIRVAHG